METAQFCSQCGAGIAATDRFCSACGSPRKLAEGPAAPTPIEPGDREQPRVTENIAVPAAPKPLAQPAISTGASTSPKGPLTSGVIYVLVYLLLAIPTYVLPYFGSNSSVLNAFGAATGLGALPQFWFHLVALYLLIVVAWMRGGHIGKQWLSIFPVFAAIFDMVPGFSVIPLLPTIFHVLALVLGVSGTLVAVEAGAAGKRRFIVSAMGLVAVVTLALVKTQTFFIYAKQGPSWEKPNARPLPPTAQSPQPLQAQPPTQNSVSADQPTTDPALSLSTTKVDPSAVTITSGGFAGLKVGHTPRDASLFFGREVVTLDGCDGVPEPAWTKHEPQGLTDITLASNSGRLVAFWVASDKYQTRSGLKVGLPESRLLELVGNDPTLERKTFYRESGMYHQIRYTLGRQGPTSMIILVRNGQITALVFGSSREVERFLSPC